MNNTPRYPHITVELVGQDGNVFNLIGLVSKALPREVRSEFAAECFAAGSYDEVLQIILKWVDVT